MPEILLIILWAVIAWIAFSLLLLVLWITFGRMLWRSRSKRWGRRPSQEPAGITVSRLPLAEEQSRQPHLEEVPLPPKEIGNPFVRSLLDALDDPSPPVRRKAIRALKDLGETGAIEALTRVVTEDESAEVREEAIGTLAELLRKRKVEAG